MYSALAEPQLPPRRIRPLDEDVPASDFTVTRITDRRQLLEYDAAWRRLTEVAMSPNAFYFPGFLTAALEHLDKRREVELWLVEAPTRVNPQGKKVLCGLFPLVRRRSFYGLPVQRLELWRHPYCFLNTPLVRRDCFAEVFEAVFQNARRAAHGASLIDFSEIDGDGPFQQALVDWLHTRQQRYFGRELWSRAIFHAAADAETFLKENVTRKRRQEAQRLERRLRESGKLTARLFDSRFDHGGDSNDATPFDMKTWIDDFLRLEASGWKGEANTALGSQTSHAEFFRAMARAMAADGQLQLLRLDFNNQPIAMICNLLAADGGFGFKIAYDEAMAKHSPGVLLELEQIRRLHQVGVSWMDSCAAPDHPMINHYWTDRVLRQSLVISTGTWLGDATCAAAPLIRWLKRDAMKRAQKSE